MRVLFVSMWAKLSGASKILHIIFSEALLKTTAIGENRSLFWLVFKLILQIVCQSGLIKIIR